MERYRSGTESSSAGPSRSSSVGLAGSTVYSNESIKFVIFFFVTPQSDIDHCWFEQFVRGQRGRFPMGLNLRNW